MPCGVFRCISVDFGVFRCILVFTLTLQVYRYPGTTFQSEILGITTLHNITRVTISPLNVAVLAVLM